MDSQQVFTFGQQALHMMLILSAPLLLTVLTVGLLVSIFQAATQLNEAGQTRESRAIEQDADALLFIVEDGLKVGKLRNGQRDETLPLYLDGENQRFTPQRHP